MGYRQELAEAKGHEISPLVLVEEILPVARGTRRVSKVTSDDFLYAPLADPKTRRSIQKYIDRHGLGFMIISGIQDVDMFGPELYFFRSGDAASVRSAGERIERLSKDMTRQEEVVTMDGELLGYSECCVSALLSDKKRHVYQDGIRVQRQLIGGDYVMDLGSLLRVRRDVLPAFFTSGFAPCRPDCSHAAETGNRILSGMQGEEREAYHMVLLNNAVLASLNMIRRPSESGKIYRRFRENEPVIQEKPVMLA